MNFSSPINATPSNSPRLVALAILYQAGKFLLQLRDDIPTIFYPGHWGLFGGHLELGETPQEALQRELLEEINYIIIAPQKFRCYANKEAIRYVFWSSLTVSLEQLVLREGWDLDLVSTETIRQGQCYSAKAERLCPLGKIHQTILLDFLAAQLV